MRPPFQPPTTHPTYGMIGALRWTSGRGVRLFGSKLPGHTAGVTIRIHAAAVSFEHGHEQVSAAAAGGRLLAEVTLSPVQWAEFITSMNVGDGVPCTVNFVAGDATGHRGAVPVQDSEPERVRGEYAHLLRERANAIASSRKHLAEKLRGRVSGVLAKEVDDVLAAAEQDLRTNAPWYVQQFTEATDRVASSVKAEVDAFLTGVAVRLGVKSLRETGLRGLLGDGGEREDGS